MKAKLKHIIQRKDAGLRRRVTAFKRDEDGAIIAFTLFVLVLSLILGGMAVDFMRLESRRSMLQGTVDRAVLAAADLDQQLDPASVVEDYFAKAGIASALRSTDVDDSDPNYRKVSASSEITLNTFFLRLIGMDQLTASAKSTAIEGVGNIEVSLVLDISGSMEWEFENPDGTMSGVAKIQKLRDAATAFVNTLLRTEYQDKVSLSLVPYSEHVNIGEGIFGALNTVSYHDFSHCVEFPAAAYTTTEFNSQATYQQTQHFQWNPAYSTGGNLIPDVTEPFCPRYSYESIIPLSQNTGILNAAIAKLQPRAGTSIFLGLKWGVALLDPTIRPILAGLPEGAISPAFEGRPADYPEVVTSDSTKKYVVLMTDGQNDRSSRLLDFAYDSPSDIAHWDTTNWAHYRSTDLGYRSSADYTYELYNTEIGDTYMQSVCTAAKERNIIIYAIAMDSTEHGETEMSKCASSPGHYYQTSGDELVEIFEAIAEQITDLRLTQ